MSTNVSIEGIPKQSIYHWTHPNATIKKQKGPTFAKFFIAVHTFYHHPWLSASRDKIVVHPQHPRSTL